MRCARQAGGAAGKAMMRDAGGFGGEGMRGGVMCRVWVCVMMWPWPGDIIRELRLWGLEKKHIFGFGYIFVCKGLDNQTSFVSVHLVFIPNKLLCLVYSGSKQRNGVTVDVAGKGYTVLAYTFTGIVGICAGRQGSERPQLVHPEVWPGRAHTQRMWQLTAAVSGSSPPHSARGPPRAAAGSRRLKHVNTRKGKGTVVWVSPPEVQSAVRQLHCLRQDKSSSPPPPLGMCLVRTCSQQHLGP